MAKIEVVTDSTCNLPVELLRRYDIHVLPINVQLGQATFQEGVNLDDEYFYGQVESGVVPKTSVPAAGSFAQVYRELAPGASTILSIHITARLSGTCQSASVGASLVQGGAKVVVYDTASISLGTGFMVLKAAQMAEGGAGEEEILQTLDFMKVNTRIYLTTATLKFLQASGRVGKLQGALASLLDVKPIIKVEDGLLEAVEKVRTRRRSLERLLELTVEAMGRRPVELAVAHARALPEAQRLCQEAQRRLNCQEATVHDLVHSLTVHGGPGIVGVISCPADSPLGLRSQS